MSLEIRGLIGDNSVSISSKLSFLLRGLIVSSGVLDIAVVKLERVKVSGKGDDGDELGDSCIGAVDLSTVVDPKLGNRILFCVNISTLRPFLVCLLERIRWIEAFARARERKLSGLVASLIVMLFFFMMFE